MTDSKNDRDTAIENVHREACDRKQVSYLDPFTEAEVFTRYYLLDRGYCCNQDCRHCPYETGYNISIRYKARGDGL